MVKEAGDKVRGNIYRILVPGPMANQNYLFGPETVMRKLVKGVLLAVGKDLSLASAKMPKALCLDDYQINSLGHFVAEIERKVRAPHATDLVTFPTFLVLHGVERECCLLQHS
ncbi:hypothetical protein PENNAL_c0073G08756 [Penicillium nalgiovense]|uniref:Uncharacterized protein n=1 Tax=Penicillium nalgiovense TaxID=60175 RepID=A0A1V6XKH4_PENNA|nr:hypothetical protein PENNAL_c0073G08756 [Penicillium nalgiovense]